MVSWIQSGMSALDNNPNPIGVLLSLYGFAPGGISANSSIRGMTWRRDRSRNSHLAGRGEKK